ncbi:hypothetical protein C0991_007138 [Blastosporella zonata]|nr:hypothetical protein C0991_007138 [Blastosporella zonata]
MPPPTPSETPSSANDLTQHTNIIIAISATIGGIILVVSSLTLYVILKRRGRKLQGSIFGHRHTRSDASSASLLRPAPHWGVDQLPPPQFDPFILPSELQRRNESTESVATIKPQDDSKIKTLYTSSSNSPPHTPPLSPLSIPSRILYSPPRPYSPESSSAASASSASLYSQLSAASTEIVNPSPRPQTPSPRLLPPMVPQYAHIRTDDADLPTRADTRVIGKLLKKRAKQNERKLTRSVSKIERMGSIRPAFDDDDDGQDSNLGPMHRPGLEKEPAVASAQSGISEEANIRGL